VPAPSTESRSVLSAWAVAALLPVPMATFWHEGSGRAFAYAYLFLGAAVATAEAFRNRAPGRWRAGMTASVVGALTAAAVLTASAWAVAGDADPLVPVLAVLAVAPAVCCVPYLTLATGQPFAAVVAVAFLMAAVKLAGCAVVRVVYGPTALADGRTTLPWEAPHLLVWLCLGGAALCSVVLYRLGRRAYAGAEPDPGHGVCDGPEPA